MFMGMTLAFLPMHLTGLFGMPRRVYTFPDGMGWDWLNLITSLGAFLFAIGVLLLLVNVASSVRRGGSPAPIPGMRPRSNGPCSHRRRLITSQSFRAWRAVTRCGRTN